MLGKALIATYVLAILLLHFWLAAIPSIAAADFDRVAVELERTPSWRYGYLRQYHGAVLVKCVRRSDAPTLVVPDANDGIAAALAPEIHRRHLKAWAELTLYVLLFVYARIAYAVCDPTLPQPSLRRRAGGALAAFGFVSLALAPYVAMGYGEPLFSTRMGPGAMSSSSVVPSTGTVEPTISYRIAVQTLVAWPLFSAIPVAEALDPWLGVRGTIWVISAVAWALAAVIAPAVIDIAIWALRPVIQWRSERRGSEPGPC